MLYVETINEFNPIVNITLKHNVSDISMAFLGQKMCSYVS